MSKIFQRLSTLFGIAMFIVAVLVLEHQLRGHPPSQIMMALRDVPPMRMLFAAILTVFCYASYTGYDFLALACLHKHLPFRSVWLNSFVCHSVSVNTGCTSILCGSMRCQYYLRKGLQPKEVVKLLLHCSLTYWLGFIALGGVIFFFFPQPPLAVTHMGPWLRPIGAACVIGILLYVIVGFVRRVPTRLGKWIIPVARTRITVAQIIISACEWVIGAAILYALLPTHPEFSYLHLLGYYFIAQALGLASQVPSGFGVFESVVLSLTPPDLPKPAVLAALVLYRVIYNMIPLCIGGSLLLLREFLYHKERKRHAAA
jgi:phosphatidylglycerol lysyltransferase